MSEKREQNFDQNRKIAIELTSENLHTTFLLSVHARLAQYFHYFLAFMRALRVWAIL